MRATRRLGAVSGLALLLVGLAVVVEDALLLLAPATVGAWLLASQVAFLLDARSTVDAIDLEQAPAAATATTDEPLDLRVTASLPRPSPLEVTLEISPPVGLPATGDRRVTLPVGDRDAELLTTLEPTIAGEFEFSPLRVELRDPAGLFVEAVSLGPTPSLAVEARPGDDLHVGAGGEAVEAVFGEYTTGRFGPGMDYAEVREYRPGDPLNRMEWNATARLDHPHVVEFESETDSETLLLVDHRAGMAMGPPGATKLEYARTVALAVVETAEAAGEPIGYAAVGDRGVTDRVPIGRATETYDDVRQRLLSLSPTGRRGGADPGSSVGPGEARRVARRLETATSPMARALAPYFRTLDRYREPVATDPRFTASAERRNDRRGTVWTVLLTDDSGRVGLRETVDAARRDGDHVVAFLTPSALFDPATDLDAAYERYREFEAFRRGLDGLDRVAAYEVGPGDRLETIRRTGRRRRADRLEV